MEKKVLSIKEQQVEVVDGKVVISSEELAKAIQNEEVRFDREEENVYEHAYIYVDDDKIVIE